LFWLKFKFEHSFYLNWKSLPRGYNNTIIQKNSRFVLSNVCLEVCLPFDCWWLRAWCLSLSFIDYHNLGKTKIQSLYNNRQQSKRSRRDVNKCVDKKTNAIKLYIMKDKQWLGEIKTTVWLTCRVNNAMTEVMIKWCFKQIKLFANLLIISLLNKYNSQSVCIAL
jgi:hypothetical protein